MFFYLYRTLCTVNDTFYVGVHSTSNLFDGYLGSGTRLRNSVAKYGISNHEIEILEYFDSSDDMYRRESQIVTLSLIADPKCLNLKEGGRGGWPAESQAKGLVLARERSLYLHENDSEWLKWKGSILSSSALRSYANGREVKGAFGELQSEMTERARSSSVNEKRVRTFSEIEHQQGSKNSQFGTCWVSNSVHTIKIKIELLDQYVSNGYVRGRKVRSCIPMAEDTHLKCVQSRFESE